MKLALESSALRRLWIGFPILFPFYFFRSGTPQVSDLYFALVFILMLVAGFSIRADAGRPVQFLLAFISYVCLISGFWAAWHGQVGIAVFSAFYVYNAVVFITMAVLYSSGGDAFIRAAVGGVALAVVVQVLLSPLAFNFGGYRQSLFFNNPNQLGYFGLLSGVVLSVGRDYLPSKKSLYLALHLCVLFLVALSLSKAALVGYFFLVGVLLLRQPVALALLLGVGIAAFPAASETVDLIAKLEARLSSLGTDADDSWAHRGYDRIWNHPDHWVFGAGEGAYRRFDSIWPGELHSSWGTLFFAYGAVGTVLFCIFLVTLARDLSFREILLTLPVFLYGITHQGLRFSMFWILLGIVYCVGAERRRRRIGRAAASDARPRLAPAAFDGPGALGTAP